MVSVQHEGRQERRGAMSMGSSTRHPAGVSCLWAHVLWVSRMLRTDFGHLWVAETWNCWKIPLEVQLGPWLMDLEQHARCLHGIQWIAKCLL